jgi:hypothetical protein
LAHHPIAVFRHARDMVGRFVARVGRLLIALRRLGARLHGCE